MIDYNAVPGDFLKLDGWAVGAELTASGDNFSDLRLPTFSMGPIKSLAIKVKVTGRKLHREIFGNSWARVRVTFLGDSEPDTFASGRLYSANL